MRVRGPDGVVAARVVRVRPQRLTVVLAQWCPHCVPVSVRKGRRLAKQLGARFRTLDIDRRAQEREADRLVRQTGDASPDYLIPQVFLEWSDGRVQHLLTGFSEQVPRTSRAWDDLSRSEWLRSVREQRSA
jgi:glutaredoxin